MIDFIYTAIEKGAKLIGSISGGKDGQAAVKAVRNNGLTFHSLIHCDLGRVEWPESLDMCRQVANAHRYPLHLLYRADKADMLQHWKNRMYKLKGSGKPFWSSKANRYCTSDLKRDPSDKYFRNCGEDFIISVEGIRAEESNDRAKKSPLSIRARITSKFYDGMTVEEAIRNFTPGKRLVLTWYPIFNFTLADVWATYGMTNGLLEKARGEYRLFGIVPAWWPFHPAYVYGNDRVSCMLCIMGSKSDLENGAKHNPALLEEMISMEEEGDATFKHNYSLKNLRYE